MDGSRPKLTKIVVPKEEDVAFVSHQRSPESPATLPSEPQTFAVVVK